MTEVLRIEEVSKQYGSHPALDKLSLSLAEGECCALLGPNGAGKTTTIKLITTLLTPTSGDIWVDGEKVEYVRSSVGIQD